MPLGLDEKCMEALRNSLESALSEADVEHGVLLSFNSSQRISQVERTLPGIGGKRSNPLIERMRALISDEPLTDFLSATIMQDLMKHETWRDSSQSSPLTDIDRYADPKAVARALIEEFEALPAHYALTFQLPKTLADLIIANYDEVDLGNGTQIRTLRSLSEFPTPTSGSKGLARLLDRTSAKWLPDRAYLQIETTGFINPYASTEPLSVALSGYREFLGLSLAFGLLTNDYTSGTHPPDMNVVAVHRKEESEWKYQFEARLDDVHAAKAFGLRVRNVGDDAGRWLTEKLADLRAVIELGSRSRRLSLAARWFFDSHCGTDELLQFVQATVVAEILLGDQEASRETSLTELLANRCAYSIAKTHSQRERLVQQFKQIYRVRSKIVHTGTPRLVREERDLFYLLQTICGELIRVEARLVRADKNQ